MNTHIAKETGAISQGDACVLVLYENPAAREQATRFSEELTKQSGAAAEIDIRCFSFDSLSVPAKSAEAIKSGWDAKVIIFAVTSAGDLPHDVKTWTENWLGKRGEREGALVGLVLGDATNPWEAASLTEVYLRHVANRAGMDYLSHVPPMIPRIIPDSLESFNQRAEQVTSLLDEILHARFVPQSLPLK
jgi:hypothetical protein